MWRFPVACKEIRPMNRYKRICLSELSYEAIIVLQWNADHVKSLLEKTMMICRLSYSHRALRLSAAVELIKAQNLIFYFCTLKNTS